jgi:Protein of unknown function (DUF4232)
MKLTMRASRRLAAGVALACAAIALPAAALAASSTPSRPATAAAPGCAAASTQVWLGIPGNGTAGAVFYQLEISNVGHHTCSLFGYPGVSAVNGSGRQVGLPASHSGVRHTVILRPGATSHVILAVGDAGAFCAHPVPAAQLRVFPPNQIHSQLVELHVQVCPHRVTMRVLPVRPGTGIPFFTIR